MFGVDVFAHAVDVGTVVACVMLAVVVIAVELVATHADAIARVLVLAAVPEIFVVAGRGVVGLSFC